MGITYNPRTVTDGLALALDAGNTKSFSPNVFPRGTDIYGWYVDTRGNATAVNSTLSRDTISSPVGNTPLKMQVTGNDPYLVSYNTAAWNLAAASSGDTWTVSFYVKASQNTTGEVLLFESNGTTYYNIPNTTYNITTSWQRISFTGTFSNANTTVIQLRLDGPNSGGSGTTVWWDGLQLERGSTASEFTKNYTLDSSLNYRTLDLTRNGNNGTLTNMDGGNLNTSNGGSLSFDGSNDYISAPLNNPSGDWIHSIEFWMYMNQNQSAISSRQDPFQIGTPSTSRYSAVDISNNNFNWYFYANDCRVTTNLFVANTWYHIGLTYAGGGATSTNKKLYINGVNRAFDTSGSANLNIPANSTLNIGRDGGRTTAYFNGRISNFKIYNNKTLSAAEVQQNFNALRGRYGI